MILWLKQIEGWPKLTLSAVCVGIVTAVGFVDFITGYETFFFIYYLVAVFLAVWFVRTSFGVLISALSVIAWISSNIADGARYSTYFIPVWNALIMFAFYLVVVVLLSKLRNLQRELEERVRQRTAALTKESEERLRLQTELLETSEREQRRISHDLHDGLCQHLTGTALASHVLGQKLAGKAVPEATEANRLSTLIEEAIDQTRTLARGLHPLQSQNGLLTDVFQELAARKSKRYQIVCRFECAQELPLKSVSVTTHLYRIAQEAVSNAARHGKARQVKIGLVCDKNEIALTISDDGLGLPENATNGCGMGLRLMAYRANLIGATFNIKRLQPCGTCVTCALPVKFAGTENDDKKNQSGVGG